MSDLYDWLKAVKVGDSVIVKSGHTSTARMVVKITKLHIVTTSVIGNDKFKISNGYMAGAFPKHTLPTQLTGILKGIPQ